MTNPVELAAQLAETFAQRAADHDAAAAFPAGDVADLRAAGLLGLLAPTRLGGLGAGFADYLAVARALARGSASTALVFNMHASVTGALAGVPDDLARDMGAHDDFFAQRDRLLRDAVAGALYGVAITEREAGSRLRAMATTYAPEGDGYRLRGEKAVCSGAGHLDGYLVAAAAADAPAPSDAERNGADRRVSHFLVPGDAVVDVDDTWDPHGMRATASNGFRLDCRVSADALLGGVEGMAVLLAYALPQWLVASYAAVYVGVAQAALAAGVEHVRGRSVVGEVGGLAGVPWVRARLGRADAQVAAASAVLDEAGRLVDVAPGEADTNCAIYRAKLLAGDAAAAVAESVSEACGLGALRRGQPLERLLRDARSGPVMPPASDLAADVLGHAALGTDPSVAAIRPW